MTELILYVIILLLGSVLVYRGSIVLEASAEKLALYYNWPPIIRGAIVLAICSSMPELTSTVLSTIIHDEFELGLSVVIGSAIFNILVIPGLSGVIAKKKLMADKELIYKDTQFYVISVIVLFLIFTLAVIYYPTEGVEMSGKITRWLAVIPILVYILYIFIQLAESKEQRDKDFVRPKDINTTSQWLKLLFSLVLIVVGVEGLVRSAIFMGDYFDTPSFLWGITIIALVTSLPDMLLSVRLAQKGEGLPSLSNVLGSNIFDLLIGVPFGILIAGAADVDLKIAMPLMVFLSLITVLLFGLLRHQLSLNRTKSWILLGSYVIFIVLIALDTLNLIQFVG